MAYKERDTFCDTTMVWSHFDASTNLNMILQSGFRILKTMDERDLGGTEKHLWVLAEMET